MVQLTSRRIITFVFATIVLALAPKPGYADENGDGYRLGGGYPVGDTGLRLGGYASAQFDVPRTGDWQFKTHDLSLFLSWDNGSRLRFFSELEGGDVLTASDSQTLSTRNAHFEFERLYFDELINDKLTVRLGKFLTPIGQWNLIHAAPLVWTSSRPVATENLFSTHASGMMLHGVLPIAGRQLEYAVYGDASDTLDPHLSRNPFKNAVGGRLRYSLDDTLQLGISFANYRLRDFGGERQSLVGLDAAWAYKKYELSAELVYRAKESKAVRSLWQGYMQGVAPLGRQWFGVGRYEFFQQEQDGTGQVGVLGLAYRPQRPLIWKLEYRLGSHNASLAPDGLSASFAILF